MQIECKVGNARGPSRFNFRFIFIILDFSQYADPCTTPPSLSFHTVFMDDAQCAETSEKSIFQFLFLELLILLIFR